MDLTCLIFHSSGYRDPDFSADWQGRSNDGLQCDLHLLVRDLPDRIP